MLQRSKMFITVLATLVVGSSVFAQQPHNDYPDHRLPPMKDDHRLPPPHPHDKAPDLRPGSPRIDSIAAELQKEAKAYELQNRYDEAFMAHLRILAMEPIMSPESPHRWQVHFNIARTLGEIGSTSMALHHATLSYKLFRELYPTPESRMALEDGRCQHNRFVTKIGGLFMKLEEPDSGMHYYQKGIELAQDHGCGGLASAYNNMGMMYATISKRDSARFYYNKALTRVGEHRSLLMSIQDNLALLAISAGNFSGALQYAENNLRISDDHFQPFKRVQAHLRIAEVSLAKKDTRGAFHHLGISGDQLDTLKSERVIEFQAKSYDLWEHYWILKGNHEEALTYRAMKEHLSDSIDRINQQLLDRFVEMLMFTRMEKFRQGMEIQGLRLQSQQEQLRLAREKAQFNWLLLVSIGTISLLVVVLLITYSRKRAREHRTKQEHLASQKALAELEAKNRRLENEQLNYKLELKGKDLSDLALYLSQVRDLNEEMLAGLRTINKLDLEEQKNEIRKLVVNLRSKLQMDNTTGLIQENIDQVNQEFYTKLSEKYPTLTHLELELCGLLRLKLSNKEIASLKNIKTESVKMSRNRLRRKLDIDPDQDLVEFLY